MEKLNKNLICNKCGFPYDWIHSCSCNEENKMDSNKIKLFIRKLEEDKTKKKFELIIIEEKIESLKKELNKQT